MIRRLCLIGVGLIGGSIVMALRQQGLVGEVIGVDTDQKNLEQALDLGVIDEGTSDLTKAVSDADWVILATPVGAMVKILQMLKPVWRNDVTYTDTGSTKTDVVEAMQSILGRIPDNFVPGHPIAGAERSGVLAANPALFQDKRVILTPVVNTDTAVLQNVRQLWTRMGADVHLMNPRRHDEVLAATSHLPHVVAFVLTEMLGRQDEDQAIFQYAAGGFRDFTRIASSDPRMWLDICLANRDQIIPLIEQLRDSLDRAAEMMANGESEKLLSLFEDANAARQRYLDMVNRNC
jgi:prephenate dehydrogenase